ncbi:MAG: crossover junction endodeoxyribonuclease RuvC, partial [Candidatus Kapabacteria bacterium]|nr:crossover junction endodeoxyribonuclease RuvC [Candidatus Kapabacteria bacterium]
MRILGIDPGSIICGYGVIEKEQNGKLILVEYGVVEAKKQFPELPRRLEAIYSRITSVIERTLPDEAAIEQVFYAKNAQSLMKLSHARGVAMLAATMKQIPIAEYSALEVKRSVTGNGHGS